MSILTSRAVKSHNPLPIEALISLPYRAAVARAAELVDVAIGEPPLTLRLAASAESLAATRAVAELLLSRLEAIEAACHSCTNTDRAPGCAREIGVLESRLTTVRRQSRLALSWQLTRPAAS